MKPVRKFNSGKTMDDLRIVESAVRARTSDIVSTCIDQH